MSSRASLNKVMLIGNLTRDPELRYTPSGAAVCTFGLATNRTYVASDGSKRDEAEFIKIVSWNKLAELCSQLLKKGRKVYVEGRLQTRSWETPDGQNRQTTEVVIDDMRILDSKRSTEEGAEDESYSHGVEKVSANLEDILPQEESAQAEKQKVVKSDKTEKPNAKAKEEVQEDKVDLDDLPF